MIKGLFCSGLYSFCAQTVYALLKGKKEKLFCTYSSFFAFYIFLYSDEFFPFFFHSRSPSFAGSGQNVKFAAREESPLYFFY